MTWLNKQLRRGDLEDKDMMCCCNKYSRRNPKKGLYCFRHYKQTPNKC